MAGIGGRERLGKRSLTTLFPTERRVQLRRVRLLPNQLLSSTFPIHQNKTEDSRGGAVAIKSAHSLIALGSYGEKSSGQAASTLSNSP